MELALILIVGGLSWWLMRPLRDWYVVEIRRGTEDASKSIFPELEIAEQSWTQSIQALRKAGESGTVSLCHIEARSRRQALSGKLPEGKAPVLLKQENAQA